MQQEALPGGPLASVTPLEQPHLEIPGETRGIAGLHLTLALRASLGTDPS